jgi:hypothetical protein
MFEGQRQKQAKRQFKRGRKIRILQMGFVAIMGLSAFGVASVWVINNSVPDVDLIAQEALVTFAQMTPDKQSASWTLSMQAKLGDGQLIVVETNERVPPAIGSTIMVRAVHHRFGLRKYLWSGEVKPPA